jgi:hypothetical protein
VERRHSRRGDAMTNEELQDAIDAALLMYSSTPATNPLHYAFENHVRALLEEQIKRARAVVPAGELP